jgi:hypothetical protein
MAVLGSIVLVVVGRLAYGTALPHSAALVAASFLLGALAFLAIGFLIAAVAPSANYRPDVAAPREKHERAQP